MSIAPSLFPLDLRHSSLPLLELGTDAAGYDVRIVREYKHGHVNERRGLDQNVIIGCSNGTW